MVTEKSAKIKSIKFCGYEDVYNMEVDDHHNFSICGGLIVHNSMDELRYYIMSRPELTEQDSFLAGAGSGVRRRNNFDEDYDEDEDIDGPGFFGV